MKVESWQGINGKLIHNGQKAIVVKDEQELADQDKLQDRLKQEGKPIDEVRKALIKNTVKRQIKTDPLKISSWFNRHQDSKNAKKTEKLVSDKPTHQYKQIKNELTFFGESFLEGSLGFYGLEVDNALGRYEHNLHVLETQELGQSEKEYYLATSENGRVKLANVTVTANAKYLDVDRMVGDYFVVTRGFFFRILSQAVWNKGFLEWLFVEEVTLHEVTVALVIVWSHPNIFIQVNGSHVAEINITINHCFVHGDWCAAGSQAKHFGTVIHTLLDQIKCVLACFCIVIKNFYIHH